MAQPIFMPEEMQHASWRGEAPEIDHANGSRFTDLDFGSWTVKLRFRVHGSDATGSGFFIDIPDTPDIPGSPGYTNAVILTAGHNLLGSDGARSKDVAVLGQGSGGQDYLVPEGDMHVSRAFTGAHGNPGVDWGVILCRRKRPKKGEGFGYSLRLGYVQHIKGTMYVSGYRNSTQAGHPVTSSGTLVAAYQEWLEYRSTTEQGLSGSVVWTNYRGCPTVVGIQYVHVVILRHRLTVACSNHSPDPARKSRGGGSRGARLNSAMLREVLEFARVGHYSVCLRAHGSPKQIRELPQRGLYLSFPEGFPFARVRLGAGSTMDIIPAESQQGSRKYAMAVKGKWALFNIAKQQLMLSQELREECLFSMPDRGTVKNSGETEIAVIIERDGKRSMLRIRGERLGRIVDDEDDEDEESSEVSLVPYPSKDTVSRDCHFHSNLQ